MPGRSIWPDVRYARPPTHLLTLHPLGGITAAVMFMGNPYGEPHRADLVHHHLHPPNRAINTMPAHHQGMCIPIITSDKSNKEARLGTMKYMMTISTFQTICPLGDCHIMEVGGTHTTVDTIMTMSPKGVPEGTRKSTILWYHLLWGIEVRGEATLYTSPINTFRIDTGSHANSISSIMVTGPKRGVMMYIDTEYRHCRNFYTPTTTTGQSKLNPPLHKFQQSSDSPADWRVRQMVIHKKWPWKNYP